MDRGSIDNVYSPIGGACMMIWRVLLAGSGWGKMSDNGSASTVQQRIVVEIFLFGHFTLESPSGANRS